MTETQRLVLERIQNALTAVDASLRIVDVGDIGLNEEGKMNGHIYGLAMMGGANFSRQRVLEAMTKVLIGEGVAVYQDEVWHSYYVVQRHRTYTEYHHLYCNDGLVFLNDPRHTSVYADGPDAGYIQEEDGKLFITFTSFKKGGDIVIKRELKKVITE